MLNDLALNRDIGASLSLFNIYLSGSLELGADRNIELA
jgi:hypothetical protein